MSTRISFFLLPAACLLGLAVAPAAGFTAGFVAPCARRFCSTRSGSACTTADKEDPPGAVRVRVERALAVDPQAARAAWLSYQWAGGGGLPVCTATRG